jgi:hypothetical protein
VQCSVHPDGTPSPPTPETIAAASSPRVIEPLGAPRGGARLGGLLRHRGLSHRDGRPDAKTNAPVPHPARPGSARLASAAPIQPDLGPGRPLMPRSSSSAQPGGSGCRAAARRAPRTPDRRAPRPAGRDLQCCPRDPARRGGSTGHLRARPAPSLTWGGRTPRVGQHGSVGCAARVVLFTDPARAQPTLKGRERTPWSRPAPWSSHRRPGRRGDAGMDRPASPRRMRRSSAQRVLPGRHVILAGTGPPSWPRRPGAAAPPS